MNLILVILMCFTLTAFPINKKLLTFDFSRFMVNEHINQQSDVDGVSFTFTLTEKESHLKNPTSVEFIVKATDEDGSFYWDEVPSLSMRITDRKNNVVQLNHSAFVTETKTDSDDQPSEYTFTVDLTKLNLDLDNGTYELELFSTHELLESSESIVIKASYFEDINYIAGILESEAIQPYLKLYFADTSNHHIVPISRPTTDTNKVFRKTVNGLLEPPHISLGLSQEPIAPRISVIQYASGLVTCYLKSSVVMPFSEDPQKASLALESMNQTIMHIQTPYAINKIQYLVDKQPSTIFFNGTDLTKQIEKSKDPQVYLGLKTDQDRVLIVPHTIASQPMEQLIPNIVTYLKTGIIDDTSAEHLLPVIPEDTELLDYKIEGVTLKLNFNSALRDTYFDSQGLSQLMLDSLASSFASIDGIDNIELQIEGKTITDLGIISFDTPIVAPEYVNVEIIE